MELTSGISLLFLACLVRVADGMRKRDNADGKYLICGQRVVGQRVVPFGSFGLDK